jgi:hypothetical protein
MKDDYGSVRFIGETRQPRYTAIAAWLLREVDVVSTFPDCIPYKSKHIYKTAPPY